ncbi:uncharacterized protein [Apostichopus japonicus]|uniref:uncharacterized protein isoform X3 n=1 Tax=Stichopus japonicus TaxID=307972 RepID=UPI003AB89A60
MGYKAGPLRVKMSWSSITQSAFLILCLSSIAVNSQQRDSYSMDILQTIGFPLAEGISFATGIQGPSFKFQGQYIVGRMANTLFPEAFSLYYPDFSIQVTLKPATRHVGPVFAVTDYLQGIIIMGINITEVNSHYNRISLFLTDYKFNDVTQEVAAFIVPALKDKWTQFAFSVKHNVVRFYFNCSGIYDTQVFYKHLGWHLTVPSNGAILVGYLGYAKQPDIRYQGLIQEILITNRASAAEEYCPSFEGSGKDANTGDLRDYADDEPRDGAFFGSGEGSGDYAYTDLPDKKGGSGTEDLAVTPTQGKAGTLPLGVSDAGVAVSPVIRTESVTVGPPIDQFDPNQPAGSSTVKLTSQTEVDTHTTPSTTRRATVTPTSSGPLKSTSKPKLPLTPTPPPPPSSPMFTSPIDSTTTKPEKATTLAPDAPASSSTSTSTPDIEQGGATSPEVIPSSPVIVPTPTGPDVTGRAETTRHDGRASSSTAPVEASSVFTEEGSTTTLFGTSGDPLSVSSGETDPILTTGTTLPDDLSVSPTVPVTSVTTSGEPAFVSSGETETFLPRTTHPTKIRTTATRLPPLPPSPTPPYIDTTREVVGGVPGPKGDAGVTGSPGEPGVPGEKGMKGDQGGDGPKGMTGGTGSPGLDGADGPKGDKGDGGLPGSKGDEGEEGLPGVAGPPGDTGIKGDQGDKGDPGDQGDKGDTGEGFPGPPGPRPTFNPEDLVGPQGTKGEKGDRGKFGPEGPDGPRGLPGKRGEQGEQGIKGEKGEPAQVLVGPEGPVGPQGPEGPPGQPGIGPEGRPGAKGARGVIGPKGMKGQKGVRGSRGPTGLQGVMGIIGPMGPSGRDGTNCSCSEGIPGRDGFNGSMGPPGPPGPMGPIGHTGLAGVKGQMGLQGLQGIKGDQGDQGIQGEQGPMGHPGLDGRHGVHGERGLQGPPGPPGPPGPVPTLPPHLFMGGSGGDLVTEDMPVMVEGLPGPPGQDGLPGLDGETGMPGPRGPMGPEGPRGEKGSMGMVGPRGVQGERGVQGPQGDMGQPGLEGMRGLMGLPGADGSTGMHGPRGPKGENGEPGISINGPPGRPGLNGPRGLKGIQGNDGPMGPPGQGGNITVEVLQKLEETFEFVSEAKHLINQTGGIIAGQSKDGVPGKDGKTGPRGKTGPTGSMGPIGYPGPRGQKGVKGDRGLAGTDGLPGLPGPQGPQGVKGDLYVADTSQLIPYKGDRGEQGKRGKRGPKGHFGISGYPGRQGPPGETGPEGPIGPQGPKGEGFAPENFKGDKGEQGPPGPSGAATSVIGAKGMQGDPGEPGRDGRDGVDGLDGQQGFAGVPGVSGPVGAPGQKGQKGDAAEYLLTKEDFVGAQGLPGPQGPPGESIPGRPGLPGPEGPPGIGKQGEPGPQGPPGLPGPTGSSGDGKETGVVKFSSIRHMVRGAASLSPGTFIFIENVQELYLRVDGGMQQVMLGSIFRLEDTPPPPTPPSPPVQPSSGKVTIEEATSGRKVTTVGPGYTHSVPTTEKAKPSVQDTTEAVFIPKITTPAPPTSLATTEVTSQSPTSTAVYSTSQSVRPFEADLGVDLLPADQPSLYMYALNYPLKGLVEGSESLNGLNGADYECYRQSKEAGLNGTFRAFLSSRVQDVKSIVREEDRMLPIMNYNNEVLYWSWSEVFDNNGLILNDTIHIFSFDGRDIMADSRWPEKFVWHGSYSDGTRMPNSYCDEWRTRNKRASGQASNLHQHQLLGQKKHKCKKPLAVLCIQAARLRV